MNIKELKFPTVYDMDTVVGYGGNQEWFSQNIKRKAGCGCTSGANLAAYYATRYTELPKIYDGNTEQFDRNEYIGAMEEMYTYMKPGLLGFPYVKKFGRQFIKFCKEHNIIAKAEFCYNFKKREEAFAFVKESIDSDNPVALLILFHRSHALVEDNWHWVTITGYSEDKEDFNANEVFFSNCGERQIVRANQLFEIHRKNTIRMVRFRIIGSNG